MIRLFLLVAALLALTRAWRQGIPLDSTTQAPLSAISHGHGEMFEQRQRHRLEVVNGRQSGPEGREPNSSASEQVRLLANSVVSDASEAQKEMTVRKATKRKVLIIAAIVCVYLFIVVFRVPIIIAFCVYWAVYGIYVILFY
jgi:hypothetical protein